MEETDEITSIQLKTSTREKLKQLGRKDQTYDEIILALLASRKANKLEQQKIDKEKVIK